jgi:hypothetical protein
MPDSIIEQRALNIDGGAGTALYRFHRNLESLGFLSTAQHIGQKQVEPRVDPGETRSLEVAADRVEITAHTGPVEKNVHH